MTLGSKLKAAIEKSEFSTEEIAEQIGMSPPNLYKIYKKESFEIKYLIQIAEILKLPLSHFIPMELEDEMAIYFVNQSGDGNAGRDRIKKQKNINASQVDSTNLSSEQNIQEIIYKYKNCEDKVLSLQEQIKLKDQLLEAKDVIINQLKK